MINRALRAGCAGVWALSVFGLAGCATYGDRVAPVPLPSAQAERVEVDGVKLLAQAYVDRKQAKAAFDFDIRGAGLLPVRFVIDNQGAQPAQVAADQTFLIDQQGQAWPLLSSEQAYERVHRHVDLGETIMGSLKPATLAGAAGAIVGLAVGIVSGNIAEATGKGAAVGAAAGAIYGGGERYGNLEGEIYRDLQDESLRNRRVEPGELSYGYLFFPGKQEAESSTELRLGLEIGETKRIVRLPL